MIKWFNNYEKLKFLKFCGILTKFCQKRLAFWMKTISPAERRYLAVYRQNRK